MGQAASDQPSDWPRVDEIQAYNRRVRGIIDELLEKSPEQNIPEQIIHVALEHRLMHAETLAYLLHNLPYDQKATGGTALAYSSQSPLAQSNDRDRPRASPHSDKNPAKFGWDNEFDEHR